MRRLFPLLVLSLVGCGAGTFDQTKGDAAHVQMRTLLDCERTYVTRHDGEGVKSLDDLVEYTQDGDQGLIDPWGQKYQCAYVPDSNGERFRFVVWTTEPKTGRVIAAPREFADRVPNAN